jgi:hypothetical protein
MSGHQMPLFIDNAVDTVYRKNLALKALMQPGYPNAYHPLNR